MIEIINGSSLLEQIEHATFEVERHTHNHERWFEIAAVPNGEIHVADRIGSGGGVFQIDAGNDDWGAWVQVLGSSDTPADAGKVKFDFHKIDIVAAERTVVYFIQIAAGVSGAAALIAKTYSDLVYKPASVQGKPAPILFQFRRQSAGVKCWMRCKCPGQNTATLDFYAGIHEYEK